MSDCRKGKIDRILTKSISRFARNTKDSLEAVRELKTLGISVYFEKENIDTGEISSEMMLAIYSQFAQEESMSISRNCRLGVKKRMMDGTYKTASTPFGYDYVEGKLQINHEKAAIVKQIFDWYVGGIGMDEIASRLNSAGVRKEVWRHGTIRCILTNEGTLDGAYFKERSLELDRKLQTAQKQLHANLNDKDGERLDELRKLIGIFERAEPITDFDEIKFGQIVEKITVLSETEIRFDLIGNIGFTERIER